MAKPGVVKVKRVSVRGNDNFLKINKPVDVPAKEPLPELTQPPAPLPGSPWREMRVSSIEDPKPKQPITDVAPSLPRSPPFSLKMNQAE